MDITNMLNNKGSVAAAAAGGQLHQHYAHVVQDRPSSDAGSEVESSSGQSSGYSSRSTRPLQAMPHVPNLPNNVRYQSPAQLEHPMSLLASGYPTHSLGLENEYGQGPYHDDQGHQPSRSSGGNESVKAFACATCGKGFARRSDLARHERIHSGVRPHVCDYPGCNKQFIQRSALTVHGRVHTGEKPHMCERCGKPFSDSSSLARHRRIHSGKRPYKCPFADCQKTFTRRTTLTRHQNHHSGTVEEAAAATAAALASRSSGYGNAGSDGGTYSDTASAASTPSPSLRDTSLSPTTEMPSMASLSRQPSEYGYMSGPLPSHLRNDLPPPSTRSSPSLPSPTRSSFSTQHRPSLTSHPATYGPPPTLEPPTHHDSRRPGTASGSPHLSSVGSMGWQSPIHPGMSSPGHGDSYLYPDPYGAPPPHTLYYPNSHLRRPHSTEPDQYELKPRMVGGEVWTG